MINIFKNLPVKIFALLLAVILWIVIVAFQQTPYQFTEELDIKPFNLPEQFSIMTPMPKAKIKVITSKEIFQNLTKKDFEAYIDLKNASGGSYNLDVLVTPKISNVTVASVQPAKISLEIENIAQKSLPIKTEVKGSPNHGFNIGKLTLDTEKADIKGAESLIKKINEIKAIVKLEGNESATFEKRILLQAFDQNGAEIKEIKIEPASVNVIVNIAQSIQQKTVGVKARLKGTPKNGFVESVKLEPSIIEIKGENKDIFEIDYIETAELDISEAVKTIEKYLPLVLPKNISLVDENKNRIKVIVEIKSY